jgi:1-acyl-sn-glycerol-3-phosphate acyltransferase
MIVMVLLMSFSVNVFQLLAFLLLPRRFAARASMALVGFGTNIVMFHVFWFSNLKLFLYGDALPRADESVIWLSNHLGSDWPFFYFFTFMQGCPGCLRFMQKDALKYVPANFSSWFNGDIFVKRGRGAAARAGLLSTIEDRMRSWAKDATQAWLVIFPEGTFMGMAAEDFVLKERSDAYCRRLGRPHGVLQTVLAPRVGGVQAAIAGAKTRGHLSAVYDITFAYADPDPGVVVGQKSQVPLTLTFIDGCHDWFDPDAPRELHAHVRRIEIRDVPEVRAAESGGAKDADAAATEDFVWSMFERKDKLLLDFPRNGFPNPRLDRSDSRSLQPETSAQSFPRPQAMLLKYAAIHAWIAGYLWVLWIYVSPKLVVLYVGLICAAAASAVITAGKADSGDGNESVNQALKAKQRAKAREKAE